MSSLLLACGTPIVIRDACRDDARLLVPLLHNVVIETNYSDYTPGEFTLDESTVRHQIDTMRSVTNQLFLVAVGPTRLVGLLSLTGGRWSRNRHAADLSMSVLQAFWGQGIGSALVDYCIQWSRSNRVVRKINLRVRTDNTRAIRLYEHKGFLHEGTTMRDMCVAGKFYDHHRMGLTLDPAP